MNQHRWLQGTLVVALAIAFGMCAYAGGRSRSSASSQARQARAADATQVKLKRIQSKAKSGRPAVKGASANSAQEIQIVGTGFGEEVSVEFMGFAGSAFTVRAAHVKMGKITIPVPPETVTGDLRLRDPAAGSSNAAKLQIVPTISTFTPAEIAPGGRLLIDGSGYSHDTQVYFQGVRDPVSPTIVSPSRIDIVVPQGARTGKVSVRTSGGRSMPKKLVVTSASTSNRAESGPVRNTRVGAPRAISPRKP